MRRGFTKRTILSTFALVFALCAVAVGYYLVVTVGEGSNSQRLGKASTETYHVEGVFGHKEGTLVPGENEAVDFKVTDTTKVPITFHYLTLNPITTSVAGCKPEWFTIAPDSKASEPYFSAPGGTPIEVQPNETREVAGASLTFTNSGVNQGACENAEVTISETAH